MPWTLCTSSEATTKAGVNANPDIIGYVGDFATKLDAFSDQSEGDMEMETGMALIDNFSNFPTGIQGGLRDICSSKIAMKIVGFDPSAYLTSEMDAILNINDEIISKKMPDMKDFKKFTLRKPIQ